MKLLFFILALIAFVLAAFDVTAIRNVFDWGMVFLSLGFIFGESIPFIKVNQG